MKQEARNLNLPPLSLYIHIPWCEKKCPYCDFNSAVVKDKKEEDYIKALLADLKQDAQFIQERKIETIFIGGGTPSLISSEGIKKLFEQLRLNLDFAENCEISLEANPGTISKEKFKAFLEVGINRLSFGVQSFQDNFLRRLGRIHTAQEARNAYSLARDIGFENINIDLMFGLPQQNLQNALDDLLSAIALSPNHLSWYQLTIEPNTAFYKKPPSLPQEEAIFDIYQQGREFLQQNSYNQYEVSAYSKAGEICRHNQNYWQFGDYLGIGSGAASKLSCIEFNAKTKKDELKIYRKSKEPIYKKYLAGLEVGNFCRESKRVAQDDLLFEFMLNSLRLKDGVELNFFSERTGLSEDFLLEKIHSLQKRDLLKISNKKLSTTEQGFLWLNEILLEFLD